MTNDENPNGNPDEQEEELGEETETEEDSDEESNEESKETEPSSGDELDNLSHEELLKRAKGQRAILQRKKGETKENTKEAPAPEKPQSSKFVTVDDFRKANRDRAWDMATAILPTDSPELKAEKVEIGKNRNTIREFVHTDNEDTPENVLKAIRRGYVAWKHDPYRPTETNTDDLQTNAVRKESSKPVIGDKTPPRRHKAVPIKEWYPKEE